MPSQKTEYSPAFGSRFFSKRSHTEIKYIYRHVHLFKTIPMIHGKYSLLALKVTGGTRAFVVTFTKSVIFFTFTGGLTDGGISVQCVNER
jgi:hypothetical protein